MATIIATTKKNRFGNYEPVLIVDGEKIYSSDSAQAVTRKTAQKWADIWKHNETRRLSMEN